MQFKKSPSTIVFALMATIVLCWFGIKQGLIVFAERKADEIIKISNINFEDSEDKKLISIATEVFKNFEHKDPAIVPVLKLRPFLTNHRIPKFLRLPDGVIETMIQKGYCDNAARMLKFILKQQNYESIQWNMIFPTRSHSALLVTMKDGRAALIDAFYGYVTADQNKYLTSPEQARIRIAQGNKFEDVFIALGQSSNPNFYQNFQDVSMAAKGENLILEAAIPLLNGKALTLGEIDGNDIDVKDMSAANGLNPYWHYIGHKYNREWIRVLKAKENTKISMTLVDYPIEKILNATPKPIVNGKTLIWHLKSDEKLVLKDSEAKLSFIRLNSYIGVDQIEISPLQ